MEVSLYAAEQQIVFGCFCASAVHSLDLNANCQDDSWSVEQSDCWSSEKALFPMACWCNADTACVEVALEFYLQRFGSW